MAQNSQWREFKHGKERIRSRIRVDDVRRQEHFKQCHMGFRPAPMTVAHSETFRPLAHLKFGQWQAEVVRSPFIAVSNDSWGMKFACQKIPLHLVAQNLQSREWHTAKRSLSARDWELPSQGRQEHDQTMQEVFSNSADEKTPLREQEFYELRLLDPDAGGTTAYRVMEAHAGWDEVSEGIVWDQARFKGFATVALAREEYERRRRDLILKGFAYSDMDL